MEFVVVSPGQSYRHSLDGPVDLTCDEPLAITTFQVDGVVVELPMTCVDHGSGDSVEQAIGRQRQRKLSI